MDTEPATEISHFSGDDASHRGHSRAASRASGGSSHSSRAHTPNSEYSDEDEYESLPELEADYPLPPPYTPFQPFGEEWALQDLPAPPPPSPAASFPWGWHTRWEHPRSGGNYIPTDEELGYVEHEWSLLGPAEHATEVGSVGSADTWEHSWRQGIWDEEGSWKEDDARSSTPVVQCRCNDDSEDGYDAIDVALCCWLTLTTAFSIFAAVKLLCRSD